MPHAAAVAAGAGAAGSLSSPWWLSPRPSPRSMQLIRTSPMELPVQPVRLRRAQRNEHWPGQVRPGLPLARFSRHRPACVRHRLARTAYITVCPADSPTPRRAPCWLRSTSRVRTSAQWGPGIYRPTITHHVVGPAAGIMLAADNSDYAALRAAAHVAPGSQPAGRMPSRPPTGWSATRPGPPRPPSSPKARPATARRCWPSPGSRSAGSAVTGGWSPRPMAPGPVPRRRSLPCPVTPPSPARDESCPATH